MNKYPYIGKDNYGKIYLMLSGSDAITMDSAGFTHTPMEEGGYTNITTEYLQNTYGEVVSPENAEFIIELAKSNNISFVNDYESGAMWFNFKYGILDFYESKEIASNEGEKQITIPLPPKQIQTATPEEEFEMTQIMKNAGDNLVLGYEQDFKVARAIINELREEANCSDELLASRNEWPKIGDEVLVYSSARRLAEIKGKVVKVIGKCTHSDGSTIITVEHSSLGVFAVANGSWIKKPKTPEEELLDEVTEVVWRANDLWTSTKEVQQVSVQEFVATKIIEKYNITIKPQ